MEFNWFFYPTRFVLQLQATEPVDHSLFLSIATQTTVSTVCWQAYQQLRLKRYVHANLTMCRYVRYVDKFGKSEVSIGGYLIPSKVSGSEPPDLGRNTCTVTTLDAAP